MSLYKIKLNFKTILLPIPVLLTGNSLTLFWYYKRTKAPCTLSDTKQAIKIQNTQFHSALLPSLFCLFN